MSSLYSLNLWTSNDDEGLHNRTQACSIKDGDDDECLGRCPYKRVRCKQQIKSVIKYLTVSGPKVIHTTDKQ